MNELTKQVIDRILDLNIQGIEQLKSGALRYDGKRLIICENGDVNFHWWHKGTLEHDYFKFDGWMYTTIVCQEQADEFVNIVVNYFGVEEVKTKEEQ